MKQSQKYTKQQLLAKYKPQSPSSMDKPAVEKLGIFSPASLEPINLRSPTEVPSIEILFIPRGKGTSSSPMQRKNAPPAAEPEKKTEVPKERAVVGKLAVFSFISAKVGADPRAAIWFYVNVKKNKEKIKGPFSAEGMDKYWMEDKLALNHNTVVYATDICFALPGGKFNTNEVKLDQFVPLESLLDHTIFSKVKARAVPEKKEEKKAAKKKTPPAKEHKKEEKKSVEAPKPAASAEDDDFDIVPGKKQAKKQKKAKAQQAKQQPTVPEKDTDEQEAPVPVPAKPSTLPAAPIVAAPQQTAAPKSGEEDFQYMPSKSQAKKMKKTKGKKAPKAPKPLPEPEEEEEDVPQTGFAAPAEPKPADKKQEAKAESKPPAKSHKKEPEPKSEPPKPAALGKKKKGKGAAVDPALLGFYSDKPKKETKEPETWTSVPQEVKKVSLEELMKEEASRSGKKK